MKYITVDEFNILGKAVQKMQAGEFTADYKAEVELKLGDTVDELTIQGIRTLKYSNNLLIGFERKE